MSAQDQQETVGSGTDLRSDQSVGQTSMNIPDSLLDDIATRVLQRVQQLQQQPSSIPPTQQPVSCASSSTAEGGQLRQGSYYGAAAAHALTVTHATLRFTHTLSYVTQAHMVEGGGPVDSSSALPAGRELAREKFAASPHPSTIHTL